MSDKTQTLVDEKLALSLFLDSLLREPELEVKEELHVDVDNTPEVVTTSHVVSDVQTTQADVIPDVQTIEQSQVKADVPGQDNQAVPAWAGESFQALLFKVVGLTLAVPLQSLNGVVEWPGEGLTEMPGHADFYLGILQHLDQSVPVVDTARLVFPQDKLKQLVGDDPLARVNRIVLINDGQWGLACDDIAEVITLNAEQVRWRSQRTQRRWLLGTVIDHMCALLDTDAFAERLVSGKD